MKVQTLINKLKKFPPKEKIKIFGDIDDNGSGSILVGGKVIKVEADIK